MKLEVIERIGDYETKVVIEENISSWEQIGGILSALKKHSTRIKGLLEKEK